MWLHEAGGRCHEGSQVQISLWPQTREDRTGHESADIGRTGFMSTTGVSSIASIRPTRSLPCPIFRTLTRCNPNGLGRSGDRVENTPVSGRDASPLGRTFSTFLRARCSQVMIMISSPTCIRCRAFLYEGSTSIKGAPSRLCRGAASRPLKSERMNPIGLIRKCLCFVSPFDCRLLVLA
jgi:hypothetical protein